MDLSPPPPPHSPNTSFPVIAIAVIGILATAFLLISYYFFVIKCCLHWHRVDRFFYRVQPQSSSSPDADVSPHKGLDQAIIRSIPVINFRKPTIHRRQNDNHNDDDVGSYECAVCLSEFQEGERLRVIPNCCHGFHIDCIDVWLQSNANCPLCRSGVSPSSVLYTSRVLQPPSSSSSSTTSRDDAADDDDHDDDDGFVVIEIQGNNFDEPRLKIQGKKVGHVCSMGDELIDMRKKDDEFQVQPIRRSISLDLSSDREFCTEIQRCCGSDHTKKSEVNYSSSNGEDCHSSKVRRSIFSFGYGRGSRGSVQPLHLDP